MQAGQGAHRSESLAVWAPCSASTWAGALLTADVPTSSPSRRNALNAELVYRGLNVLHLSE